MVMVLLGGGGGGGQGLWLVLFTSRMEQASRSLPSGEGFRGCLHVLCCLFRANCSGV